MLVGDSQRAILFSDENLENLLHVNNIILCEVRLNSCEAKIHPRSD